jgi:hypothetical protein
MLRRGRIGALRWLTAGLLAGVLLPAPAHTATPMPHKGISADFGELASLSAGDLAARISDLRALGVAWIRLDFDWSLIQPKSESQYDLTAHDTLVKAMTAAGIQVLAILDYTPAWANGGQKSKFYPPTKASSYAGYAEYLVTHYAPMGVHAWEIWNEPNLAQFWSPAPNPADYTALLKAAYPAIHKADPNATVLTAGLSQPGNTTTTMSALNFLQAIYGNGGKGYFDAVADHPYDAPYMPSDANSGNTWNKLVKSTPSFLSIMTANGDAAKSIWLTEYGAPTSGTGVIVISEEAQAQMLTQAYQIVSTARWAGPLFLYNYKDYCAYGSSADVECFFGIYRSDGARKPAYGAYQLAPQ